MRTRNFLKAACLLSIMAALVPHDQARATVLFTDNFDSDTVGSAPNSTLWPAVLNATVQNNWSVSPNNSLEIQGNPGVANAYADTKVLGSPQASFWVQADVLMPDPTTTLNGAGIQMQTGAGLVDAALRLFPNGTNAYTAKVLTGSGLSASLGTFSTSSSVSNNWVFGATFGGTDTYSVYLNGTALATNVAFTTFSSGAVDPTYAAFFGDDKQWQVDNVTISTTNPVPEPATCALLGLGLATAFLFRRRR